MTKQVFATIGQRKLLLISLLLFGGIFLASFVQVYARERASNPDRSPRETLVEALREKRLSERNDRPVPTAPATEGHGHPMPTGSIGDPPTPPTPPPVSGGVEPYAEAPSCASIGVVHSDRAWHGIWNPEYGCHWDHEHKQNPHDMDDVFGTKIYSWAGGELSYPWQTYHGAGQNFETQMPEMCTENTCKHQGYKWLYFKDRTSAENVQGALLLGTHVITDARVQYHQIGGQMGALTRFHSVWLDARACYKGQITDATCGTYSGGGWLDLGRLNFPARGVYAPLPGDPAEFADTPAELEPYRIHAVGKNSLDSWQSEGNQYNFLPSDPTGSKRLRVGYGIHFVQGESPSETDVTKFTNPHSQVFWCLDPVTSLFTCDNDNSAAALFRTWVSIPYALDGSEYDEDSSKNGYFTFHGFTNRYGDIVAGCTGVGLDCIPAEAQNFPVGGCTNSSGVCKAAYRGSLTSDTYEANTAPAGVNWIKYPN